MRLVRRQRTPKEADQLEHHVRVRSAQIKPTGTPLGICHICSSFVYGSQKLVLTAGSPLHDDCVNAPVAR